MIENNFAYYFIFCGVFLFLTWALLFIWERVREVYQKKLLWCSAKKVSVYCWNLFWKIIWGANLRHMEWEKHWGQNENRKQMQKSKNLLKSPGIPQTHPCVGNKVCDRRLYRMLKAYCVINGTDTWIYSRKQQLYPSISYKKCIQTDKASVKHL